MTPSGTNGQLPASRPSHDDSYRRSALGLGPLETAIMQALWDAGTWVTIADICGSMNYHRPVSYNSVGSVIGVLCHKGLAVRQEGTNSGRAGTPPWWYRPARSQDQHTGELIAALLDQCPSPTPTLAHALAITHASVDVHALVLTVLISPRACEPPSASTAQPRCLPGMPGGLPSFVRL